MTKQPAFGGMLQQLVSLGALEFRPRPLDAIVERRLKTIWEQAPCPDCGATTIRTYDDLDRIWCRGCGFMSTVLHSVLLIRGNSPPASSSSPSSSTLIRCSASIKLLPYLIGHTTRSILGDLYVEAAFQRGFPSSGIASITLSTGQRRSMKPSRSALGQGTRPTAGRSVPRRVARGRSHTLER